MMMMDGNDFTLLILIARSAVAEEEEEGNCIFIELLVGPWTGRHCM
jgi:hypothetical protein